MVLDCRCSLDHSTPMTNPNRLYGCTTELRMTPHGGHFGIVLSPAGHVASMTSVYATEDAAQRAVVAEAAHISAGYAPVEERAAALTPYDALCRSASAKKDATAA